MRTWAALLCSVSISSVAAAPAEVQKLPPQDEATIKEMYEASLGYVRAANWAAWAAQYAEDGVFHPPNAPAVKGRAAIQKWGEAFPPIGTISFANIQVWGEANLSYSTSGYSLTFKTAPPDTGKQLVVCRRSAAGKWEVVAVSFNSDLPPPGQAAPAAAKK